MSDEMVPIFRKMLDEADEDRRKRKEPGRFRCGSYCVTLPRITRRRRAWRSWTRRTYPPRVRVTSFDPSTNTGTLVNTKPYPTSGEAISADGWSVHWDTALESDFSAFATWDEERKCIVIRRPEQRAGALGPEYQCVAAGKLLSHCGVSDVRGLIDEDLSQAAVEADAEASK